MTEGPSARKKEKKVKCLVWDLDNTLWEGTLLEGDQVRLRKNVVEIIKTLDGRGILQSVASKNDDVKAMEKLVELGLEEYFICPQIGWDSKVASIEAIARAINIGIDTVAFVDDEPFERDEVRHSLPDVLCIDAAEVGRLLEMPEMTPRFITEDSTRRREMYRCDVARRKAEREYAGPTEEFLATIGMVLTISAVGSEDLKRANELTVRTNQLNTTGYSYSYEELDGMMQSERHKLLMAGLQDNYGTYGKIGLVLLELEQAIWTIKLLLMSCRVMSRGVGSMLLSHIMRLARAQNVTLRAEYIANERNRMMYVTYKFAGFKEVRTRGDVTILESDLSRIQPFPEYARVVIE